MSHLQFPNHRYLHLILEFIFLRFGFDKLHFTSICHSDVLCRSNVIFLALKNREIFPEIQSEWGRWSVFFIQSKVENVIKFNCRNVILCDDQWLREMWIKKKMQQTIFAFCWKMWIIIKTWRFVNILNMHILGIRYILWMVTKGILW